MTASPNPRGNRYQIGGGFSIRGGGEGINRAPKTWGGVGKKAPLTGPGISDDEVWRQRPPHFFLTIETGQFFPPPNTWQTMSYLNPLAALIPRIPFSFFCRLSGPGHLRGPRVSLGRILGGGASIEPFVFLGGGSSQGALSTPPPRRNVASGGRVEG